MKRTFYLSFFLGLFFGVMTFLLLDWMGVSGALSLSALAALLFFLLLLVCLILSPKLLERKYAELEAQIASPVFHKTSGNFDLGGGIIRHGRIYFCDDGIVCAGLDAKPYSLDEIPVQSIRKIRFDPIHLHLYLKDGRIFLITLPNAEKVMELLLQRDWVE